MRVCLRVRVPVCACVCVCVGSTGLQLRGSSGHLLEEAERSLHDALCVLTETVKDNRVVYGGGCMEVGLRAASSFPPFPGQAPVFWAAVVAVMQSRGVILFGVLRPCALR